MQNHLKPFVPLSVSRRLAGSLLMLGLLMSLSAVHVSAQSDGDSTGESVEPIMVNVNRDDALTLSDLLSGIGPARAEAIIDYRKANGRFATPEDLLAVSGIGPATLEGIRDQLEFPASE